MYHLQKQAWVKLQALTYAGETKNCNFERYVTAHKEKHTILEELTKHGYNVLDDRKKVIRLMNGVKLDSLDTVKEMILANSYFLQGL